jgi:hypothetical protein
VFIECLFWDSSGAKAPWYLMSVNNMSDYKFNSTWRNMRLNIDKDGNVNLSNGTTVNIYKYGLINEWFDAQE